MKVDQVRLAQAGPHFFRACQVLAYAFLERNPDIGFHARRIKPVSGYAGNHIFVTDGNVAFDYHGLSPEDRLLSFFFRQTQRCYRDALRRARAVLDRFGDLKGAIVNLRDRLSAQAIAFADPARSLSSAMRACPAPSTALRINKPDRTVEIPIANGKIAGRIVDASSPSEASVIGRHC